MPNDQSHDTRTTNPANRVAQAVGLSVAEVASGGEASITGTLAHGNIVTLNDPQNRLGTRTNTKFRHWQQGSEIFLNGVESTAEDGASVPDTTEVWDSYYPGGTTIVTDNLRHARIDQQYRGLGKGACITAKAFDGIGAEAKLYFAKWVRAGSDPFRMYTLGYTGLTGTFQTNARRTRGETVTISLVGGGTKTGWVTMVSNGYLSIEITGGSGGSAVIDGATVTGDASGATLTIDASIYGAVGSTKICRIRQDNSSGPYTYVTTSNARFNGLIAVDGFDGIGGNVDLVNDDSVYRYGQDPGVWHLYELEIDFSGATGVVRERIDNGLVAEYAGLSKDYLTSEKGFYLANVGLDMSNSAAPDEYTGLNEDWGEIVADNDLKRLVIGDAPVLADCTQIEIQNHTSWAAGAVGFKVNQGGFDSLSGKYLFAVGGGFAELLQVAL